MRWCHILNTKDVMHWLINDGFIHLFSFTSISKVVYLVHKSFVQVMNYFWTKEMIILFHDGGGRRKRMRQTLVIPLLTYVLLKHLHLN
jgi:hypothetical protein